MLVNVYKMSYIYDIYSHYRFISLNLKQIHEMRLLILNLVEMINNKQYTLDHMYILDKKMNFFGWIFVKEKFSCI